jgi:hypothetical protein
LLLRELEVELLGLLLLLLALLLLPLSEPS